MNHGDSRRRELMHNAREQEIAIIFNHTPERAFARCLELGAGDCHQSRFLKRYVADLTCTDFDESLLDRADPQINYRQCDAEQVDEVFHGQRFDLVFASNMLPHTPDQHAVLTKVATVLDDQGILVIVVPNPSWKLFKLASFYPRLVVGLPERVLRRLWVYPAGVSEPSRGATAYKVNNPKAARSHSRLRRFILPVPIGVYDSNIAEVFGARKSVWIGKLHEAGWDVISVRKGPFICGDLTRGLHRLCASLGFATEYAYIAKKAGKTSPYEAFFS